MKEETKEETKEEVAAEAPKAEELIKEEALNSTPTMVEDKLDAWKSLRGKEFISWLGKHPRGL